MAHPTCAHARLPNDPLARADSPDAPLPDPFELVMQAVRQIKSARSIYQVIACIHGLADATEARELMAITDAEFQRRVQCAMKTLRSMRSPSRRDPIGVNAPGRAP